MVTIKPITRRPNRAFPHMGKFFSHSTKPMMLLAFDIEILVKRYDAQFYYNKMGKLFSALATRYQRDGRLMKPDRSMAFFIVGPGLASVTLAFFYPMTVL